MKKGCILVAITLFVLVIGVLPSDVQAQVEDDILIPNFPPIDEIGDIITFEQVGFTRETLQGQFDLIDLFLTIPANWRLVPGAQIELDVNVFIEQVNLDSTDQFGGSLEIYFEDTLLDTVILNRSGPQTLTLPIPDNALEDLENTSRYHLQLILDGRGTCDSNPETITTITVQPTSRFVLPHEDIVPIIDLQQLPRPIYQRSFLPDTALLLMPDDPTALELQAATRVAAAFGKLTSGNLMLFPLPIGHLTPELRDSQHLIAVGDSAKFDLLSEVPFVSPAASSLSFTEDDGLLQMAISPWNPEKIILYIGGESEEGMNKAAQALSSGYVRAGGRAETAVVKAVYPERLPTNLTSQINSLTDFGYELQTIEGVGREQIDIDFYTPPGQIVDRSEGATFNLAFVHSALLDYDRSGIVIQMNGEPVGSIALSEQSTSIVNETIKIPSEAIRSGFNTLTLEIDLRPRQDCNERGNDTTWLAIRPETTLALPLQSAEETVDPVGFRLLNDYPEPFSFDRTIKTTTLVVPPDDPLSWQLATQLAFDISNRTDSSLVEFSLVFGDDITEPIDQEQNLILIGLATSLPALDELNEDLPSPFLPNSTIIEDEQLLVEYDIPQQAALGYLQLTTAPWQAERIVLLISGNSVAGLKSAAAAFLNSPQRREMSGNLAVVHEDQIYIAAPIFNIGEENGETAQIPAETEEQILTTAMPSSTVTPTSTPLASATPQPTPEPTPLTLSSSLDEPGSDSTTGLTANPSLTLGIAGLLTILVILAAFFVPRRFFGIN